MELRGTYEDDLRMEWSLVALCVVELHVVAWCVVE